MSSQQTLKFTIRQDGQVTEEATGFTSHECVEITKSIEEKRVVTYTEWLKMEENK